MELTKQQSLEHGQHLAEELYLHGAVHFGLTVIGHPAGVEVNAVIDNYPVSCVLMGGNTIPWGAVAEALMADMEKLKIAAMPPGSPLLKPQERLLIHAPKADQDVFTYRGYNVRWHGWNQPVNQFLVLGAWFAEHPVRGYAASTTGAISSMDSPLDVYDVSRKRGWPLLTGRSTDREKNAAKENARISLLRHIDLVLHAPKDFQS